MRILQVTDLYPPVLGGLENHVADLSARLAEAGAEVHVATQTANPRRQDGVTAHVLTPLSSRLIRYQDPERRFHPPLPDPSASRQLAALINQVRPDVIHGHSWLSVSVPRRAMNRLVLTAHDYSFICQLRTLLHTGGEICDGPAPIKCIRCAAAFPGSVRHPAMMAGTRLGRAWLKPQAVIAVSEKVRQHLEAYLPVDRVHVVPNFVDASIASTGTDPPTRDFALFAGDPGLHKGSDTLLRAWSGAHPPRVPLTMATTRPVPGPLPERVNAVQLPRRQVLEAIRNALCVVVPSNWDDPCPTVALEALALGTPIVATAVGGLPAIVSNGETGLLIPRGDDGALVAAVDRLAGDRALVNRLSTAARTAAAAFTSTHVIPRIVELYEATAAAAELG